MNNSFGRAFSWTPISRKTDQSAAFSSLRVASTLLSGLLILGLGSQRPGQGGGGDDSPAAGSGAAAGKKEHTGAKKTDLTTCAPGQVWDKKAHKCLRDTAASCRTQN